MAVSEEEEEEEEDGTWGKGKGALYMLARLRLEARLAINLACCDRPNKRPGGRIKEGTV